MKLKVHNYAYGPFTSDFKVSELGAFHEALSPDGKKSRYVAIWARKFNESRNQEFERQGVSLEDRYAEVRQLGRRPAPGTQWLYTVETFAVEGRHHVSVDAFVDNSTDYSSKVFDNLQDAVDYCIERFDLHPEDFKRQSDTGYLT